MDSSVDVHHFSYSSELTPDSMNQDANILYNNIK